MAERPYNYEHFPEDLEDELFSAFASFLKVGEKAPDGELIDARTNAAQRLSSLWQGGLAVLEFGSVT